jgi:hypothetical protein
MLKGRRRPAPTFCHPCFVSKTSTSTNRHQSLHHHRVLSVVGLCLPREASCPVVPRSWSNHHAKKLPSALQPQACNVKIKHSYQIKEQNWGRPANATAAWSKTSALCKGSPTALPLFPAHHNCIYFNSGRLDAARVLGHHIAAKAAAPQCCECCATAVLYIFVHHCSSGKETRSARALCLLGSRVLRW